MIALFLACAGTSKPDAPPAGDSGTTVDTAARDSGPDSGTDSGRDSAVIDDTAPCTPTLWYYVDADGDGWGTGASVEGCEAPGTGWATQDGDCDDAEAATYPGTPFEPCVDRVDRNCDGVVNGQDVACDLGLDAEVVLSSSSEANAGSDGGWGDFDGDGSDDVVLAAPGSDACWNEDLPGYVYGFTADAWGARELSIDSTDAAFTVEGVNDGWCFGNSVASGGDVDGDGLDDIVIGEPAYPPDTNAYGNPGPGNVYLFLGSELQPSQPASDAAVTVSGEGDYDTFGAGVGAVGDVDGDGFDDLYAGAVSPRLLLGSSLLAGTAMDDAVTLPGRADPDLGVPGDIDGDGLDDVVLRDDGLVFLGASVRQAAELDEADADYAIADASGSSHGGEDLDGDGRAEVLARAHDSDESWAVYHAADLEAAGNRASVSSADASVVLEFAAIVDVQSHGDLDGDSRSDLLVIERSGDLPCRTLSGASMPDQGTLSVSTYATSWGRPDSVVTTKSSPYVSTPWLSRADGDLEADGVHEILLGTTVDFAFILRDW